MFCYQCEQTDRTGARPGCASAKGNCGKDSTTADLQDLLVHAVKGIAQYGAIARTMGVPDREAERFVLYAMFTTLTNVNFHAARFVALLREAAQTRDRVKAACEAHARAAGTAVPVLHGPAEWQPADDLAGLLKQAASVGIDAGLDTVGADIVGLRALVLYGLKGVCAYAHHAQVLGYERDDIYEGVDAALAFLAGNPADVDALLAHALDLGRLNLTVMELLDNANTGRFGVQQPSAVRVSPVAGKAILVSGHDLGDLHALLEQTAGTGIQVYTHGEMLPAHAYPSLKAFPHLAGNYGGAWQDQQSDFARFPGPILMTSNCIIEPLPQYRQRIFTTGPVGWPGVRHLEHHDFPTLIRAAQALPGFQATAPEQTITVGFGRHAVLGVADKVIDAVKAGQIRHFFLIGGCDGAAPGRNYYTEFAEQAPDDTVVMTLGCNKYRFNRHAFGDIGGIPRLLDIGQCNDSYSAIRIATALADAFECGVNDLPLSLVISWFEQKAAAVLLTLLALGIRNIRLGPTLPAFVTPGVLAVLVDQFGIQPIGDAGADLAAALARRAA
ncbi:hydroxylamine reductase [Burkholderia ambifaria AMMD]|uniref:Hydroxylamine reductase n=2 Tax=Burkholderia ambifaria TaxID=152480 RepID=HCP_BURA4|nr:hydroxylamine reductase [Burkholderia ambifaria]B1YXE9.1 RecName: Full=Hydroxylamine reductase; AltName: Full=Hybrid-cluster protein; Short=HCP; AltName: Full=Prismane protein [Burkholderia ambifaria MC40-6]Q0B880.1 RecName: Full=Hydroxylamine reductase; AltName: Full=Hybrid-cluster protein; Short=HCP; AltName: Full=Prismane protein [Burkholderia ambifaria AMMD]ABI89643.1 hydroxylamine reductase precursor [Burkholderia ambifaria AMMD]ACB67011.1 hybrid cluster protein [Burkholderia ambifaria 